MKQKNSILVIVIAIVQIVTLVFLLPSVVRANPDAPRAGAPSLISYQGYLTDENGDALMEKPTELKIGLYGDAIGGTALWEDTFTDFEFSDGYFRVMLPLSVENFDDPTTWLQVEIDGASMPERQQIASVPYALQAEAANTMSWNGLTDVPEGFADGVDNGGSTAYTAGTGLELDGNQFNVTGAPWGGLTDIPSGFSDNVDNTVSAARGCRVLATGAQEIAPALALTELIFGELIEGEDNCWSLGQSTRLYARTAGYYLAGAGIVYYDPTVDEPIGDGGRVGITISRNRSDSLLSYLQSSDGHFVLDNESLSLSVSTGMFYMQANDYIEVIAYQNVSDDSISTYYSGLDEDENAVNAWLVKIGE